MERSKRISDTSNVVMVMPNGGASDKTLKKNVAEVTAALERITKLRPVTWEWRDKHESPRLQHGFIAQELEAIFPELVGEKVWEDGTLRKFVYSDALIPYLVKALQEQRKQITALSKAVNKLQGQPQK